MSKSICLRCAAVTEERMPPWLFAPASKRGCSICGTKLIPARDGDQVTVTLGWQELRLLVSLAITSTHHTPVDDGTYHVLREICAKLSKSRPRLNPPLTAEDLVRELRLSGVDIAMVDDHGIDWPEWGPDSGKKPEQGK